MLTPNEIKIQINRILRYLVESGLADDQKYALIRSGSGRYCEVTYQGASYLSVALRDRAYDEIYDHLFQARSYNAKLPDGAMIQMGYEFLGRTLQRHRLAFFPSPYLEEFQNSPDIYVNDEIYADVVAKNIVAFPIRFDYDSDDSLHQELVHPKSHMTLGQYKNCRIPVSAPMTPVQFVDFILRNFYHTAFARYADMLAVHSESFAKSILASERSVLHVVVPG